MRFDLRGTGRHRGVTGFAVGVIATMTIAGGGVALASIPSSSTAKFTGCVAKQGGALRVIDAQSGKKCKSSEKKITWSKGWTHRGAWASGTTYKPGDVVTQSGSSYVAKSKSTGVSPGSDASKWGLLAAAGATGATGTTGAQGPNGVVDVAYVSATEEVTDGLSEINSISCPAGKSVTGGGVRTENEDFEVIESGPFDAGSRARRTARRRLADPGSQYRCGPSRRDRLGHLRHGDVNQLVAHCARRCLVGPHDRRGTVTLRGRTVTRPIGSWPRAETST